jgi:hypothetical protein
MLASDGSSNFVGNGTESICFGHLVFLCDYKNLIENVHGLLKGEFFVQATVSGST